MFNVTILKMKDIKKYLAGMIITGGVVIVACNYIPKIADKSKAIKKPMINNNMIGCLEQTIPVTSAINEKSQNFDGEINLLQDVLKTEIASIDNIEKKEGDNHEIENTQEEQKQYESTEEDNKSEDNNKSNENTTDTQLAQTGVTTQVITNNPIKESYNSEYKNIKIKNETEYQLTENMLVPDVSTNNKNIILFHTHTCESYTSSEAYSYIPTGNYRTTDLNYTVVKVGSELENQLKQYKFNVIHDTSYHDYPSYNGSYAHSLATVENLVKTTPSDVIIDVHRDAIGSRSDYAPIVKIGENDIAAQLMFVIRDK